MHSSEWMSTPGEYTTSIHSCTLHHASYAACHIASQCHFSWLFTKQKTSSSNYDHFIPIFGLQHTVSWSLISPSLYLPNYATRVTPHYAASSTPTSSSTIYTLKHWQQSLPHRCRLSLLGCAKLLVSLRSGSSAGFSSGFSASFNISSRLSNNDNESY